MADTNAAPAPPSAPARKAKSGAERQREYMARLRAGAGLPPTTTKAPAKPRKGRDRRSRPQRWRDAVTELLDLQDEWRDWLDSMPESLDDSPTHQRLTEICDFDLSELEALEPPRGFGRD